MYQNFLIFRVAGYLCAVPTGEVQEIVPIAATACLPGQPLVLHGLLNLRGSALPVISLRRLFGQGEVEPDLYAPFIVMNVAAARLVLLADAVEEVIEVDQAALRPIDPQHSFNDCATAQFSSKDGVVIVLSVGRLLLLKERTCIAALQVEVQQRIAEIGETSA